MKFLTLFSVIFLASAFVDLSVGQCSKKFQESFLERANFYRAKHGVGPLSLDGSISSWAQDWANQIAKENKMHHRQGNKYGENIAMQFGSGDQEMDGKQPIDMWYNEVSKYSGYGAEPDFSNFMSWGHFTQLVWKGSSKVGVGCAKTADGKAFYVVANFDAPGNMIGDFKHNVFPSKN